MFEYVNKETLSIMNVYQQLDKCDYDSPKMLYEWCTVNIEKLLKQKTIVILSLRHLSDLLEREDNYLN